MPAARRPQLDERRRLVIYSQRYSADAPAQSQRARDVDAALRGARKPAAAYGWRVQRRLRARWFGVVPVRRRALIAVVAGIVAMIAALALGHWASLWWPGVALHPALARPLRLDRPDSLGTWLGAVMMAAAAGGSLMVYQLRRYRADDYRGHYRMWRLTVVICLLASVDAVIHLADWLGAAIDVALAERDVLAGADWVRLLLTVGGAAFGLRMTVELARCRTAAGTMIVALGLFGLSSLTHWNLLRMDEATAVTWLPISLMAGRAAFLVAVIVYLRMLYREVRKMESSDGLRRQLQKLVPWRRPDNGRKRRRGEAEDASETAAEETPRRRATKRSAKRVAAADETEDEKPTPARKRFGLSFRRRPKASDEDALTEDADDSAEPDEAKPRKRLGLSFRRRAKASDEDADTDGADESAEPDETKPRKRLGLPFRRRAKAADRGAATEDDSTEQEEAQRRKRFSLSFRRRGKVSDGNPPGEEGDDSSDREETRSRTRFGLPFRRRAKSANEELGSVDEVSERDAAEVKPEKRSWFSRLRRQSADEEGAEEDAESADVRGKTPIAATRPKESTRGASQQQTSDPDDDDGDDAELDGDDGEFSHLSKSERRRARKLLKRQGRAA